MEQQISELLKGVLVNPDTHRIWQGEDVERIGDVTDRVVYKGWFLETVGSQYFIGKNITQIKAWVGRMKNATFLTSFRYGRNRIKNQ